MSGNFRVFGHVRVADGTGGWGSWVPWRVTAEAGVGWGQPGAADLSLAGMCPHEENADGRSEPRL